MRNEADVRPGRCHRAAAATVAVLLFFLLAVGSGRPAASADLYRVDGVPVDATGETGVAAREQAIAQGEREGLTRLMRRLTSPNDLASLPPVEELPIERYANSYEVAQEKVGPTRYLGILNIAYVAAEVQRLLRNAGIPYVTRRSDPILVVPVELTASGPAAWLETSPWHAAWYGGIEQAKVTVLALPLGDLEDVAAAPPEAIASGDKAAVDALAARYHTDEAGVVVATARLDRTPDTGRLTRIELAAHRGDAWLPPLLEHTVDVPEGQDEQAALAGAVALVVDAIENDWKRRTLIRRPAVALVPVAVPLADLAGWVQIRDRLASLPEVSSLAVESFGQTEARLDIGYAGDLEQLLAAVQRIGFSLVQESDGWHLRPAADVPAAAYPVPLPAVPASP